MLFKLLTLCWALEQMSLPFKSSLSVCCSCLGLIDPSPVGFQSQIFWRLFFQVQVVRVGVSDVWGMSTSLLRGKFWFVSSLLVMHWHVGGGVTVRLHLSLCYLLWCAHFLFDGQSCLASFHIFFRGNFSWCSCSFSVSMKEVSLESYYVTILDCLLSL